MELLTLKEAAEYLRCSPNKFRGLLISYIKIGGRRMYRENDLNRFLASNTVTIEEKPCAYTKGQTRRISGTASRLTEFDIEKVLAQQIKPSHQPSHLKLMRTSS